MNDDVKLIVTGSSGFLGKRVVRKAIQSGWIVTTLDICTSARHDVRDVPGLRRLFEMAQPDAVIHAASTRDRDKMYDVIVGGSAALGEVARQHQARLVHLSSDSVFSGSKGEPYVESDPPDPVNEYGVAKASAEIAVLREQPDSVVVRTSLLLGGPGSPGLHEALARRTGIPFWSDYIRRPLLVDDLAAALVQLVSASYRGVLHIAGDEPFSRAQLASLITGGEVSECLAPPGTPQNVQLDSRLARECLDIAVRGPRCVYGS